jgi:hypothetical protein
VAGSAVELRAWKTSHLNLDLREWLAYAFAENKVEVGNCGL